MGKVWPALLAVAAFAWTGHARADVAQAEEYMKRLKIYQTVQPHGETPFGEQINLYTGEVSFQQTDVTYEGTGPAISFVRTSTNTQTVQTVARPDFAGQWSLSIPRIETLTAALDGWSVGPASDPDRTARCTHFDRPYSTKLLNTEWWQGMDLITEDGRRQPILKRAPQNTLQPTMTLNGQPLVFPALTQQNWQIGCLPNTSNGVPGEAFLAVSPDGTRYWFDRLQSEPAETFYEHDEFSGTVIRQQRGLSALYVTRVEDRFGNYLTYQYTGDKLTSITASDGRAVNLLWRADSPVVDQIIVQPGPQQRTWRYEYDNPSPTSATLLAVVLPDESRWTFDATPFATRPLVDINLSKCTTRTLPNPAGTVSRTMVHPSGLVGTFTTAGVWHARSYVPSYCHTPQFPQEFEPYEDNPPLFGTASLISKTLSGPGLTNKTWTYAYSAAQGSANYDPCAATQTCTATAWVDAADPDGNRTRYTHSTRFDATETKLLQADAYQGANTLLRSETRAYAASNAGPYPAILGGSMINGGYNGFTGGTWTPMNAKTVSQQGVGFSWQASGFDAYANPLGTTRSSTLGYSRTDVAAYSHNTAKWVIGQLATSTNSDTGLVESRTDYDANALPWKTYAFGKLQQTLAYNADGTLSTVKDGNNNVTAFANWKRGIPQLITFPATLDQPVAVSKSAQVNALGQIDWVVDENGYKTCYDYDAMGRLSGITYPSETAPLVPALCDTSKWAKTTRSFVPVLTGEYGIAENHWKQTVSTGNGRQVTVFDALWRPVVTLNYDATNAATTAATMSVGVQRYDAQNRPVFQSYPRSTLGNFADPAIAGTDTAYDALGRPTSTQADSELGALTTAYEYLAGFQTRVTNPRGFQTTTRFMAYDQPTTDWPMVLTHPEGALTNFARDTFGKVTAIVRHNADNSDWNKRYISYYPTQEICETTEVETGTTAFGYDGAGNLTWSAAALPWAPDADCDYTITHGEVVGRRVDRTYDARNRLKTLHFPNDLGDQLWTYTPDNLPAQTTAYNAAGQTVPVVMAYNYNRRRLLGGQGETLTQPNWYSWGIGYGYNANGHLASLVYPSGLTATLAPNAVGQPTQLVAGTQNFATAVSYYPNGAIKQFTYGNGFTHTLSQNARGLPLVSCDFFSSCGASTLLNDEYSYDKNGNVAAIADQRAGHATDRVMTYDGLDRLKTVVSPLYGAAGATYAYDTLDNLTRVNIGGPAARDHAYCYDDNNRLTNVKTNNCTTGSSVIGLGYDERGNRNNKNGQLYGFDYGNRLREATGQEYYRYDARGMRVQGWHPTLGSIFSQYSQAGQLMYQRSERTQLSTEYLHLGGSLVAIREQPLAGGTVTVKYQHTDALGSPIAVSDASRAIIETNQYEPYGKVINHPLKDGPGYTGHVADAATGLIYMQQRYYDDDLGGFPTVDPVTAFSTGGTFNRYWYANNNPYRFTDPDGRSPVDDDPRHRPGPNNRPPRPSRPPCSEQCMRMRNTSDRGQSGATISYNAPPPRTVPPSGENAQAMQCTVNCAGATGNVLVTGGAEQSGHSRNSLHYANQAVDIVGPPYNNLQHAAMMRCAGLCGYTHGWWEKWGSPQRDHWHFQIGQRGGVPALESAQVPDWPDVQYGARMDGWRAGP